LLNADSLRGSCEMMFFGDRYKIAKLTQVHARNIGALPLYRKVLGRFLAQHGVPTRRVKPENQSSLTEGQ